MPKIDGKEISREVLAKAMLCETPEELVKLAKENGVELTAQEAEAYLSEMEDIDLDSAQLKELAGGYGECPDFSKSLRSRCLTNQTL